MLVLRKEIKIGVAAGVAILGIAGVYGLMASLSGNGSKDTSSQVASADPALLDNDPLHGAKSGLPPVDTGADDTTKTAVKPLPDYKEKETPVVARGDPFAESNRTDGNTHSDALAALSSGKIGGEVNTVSPIKSTDSTLTYRAPTPSKSEPKFVSRDPAKTSDGPSADGGSSAKSKTAAHVAGDKYVVQPGDTFSTIASKVYGSKKFYAALVKANPDVNPSRMKVGHEITVPPKESVASVGGAIEPDAAKLSAPIDASRQYRIAPGDTLSHIASKLYGKSAMWQAIYEANKTAIGPDEARLKVGTLLNLPEKPVR